MSCSKEFVGFAVDLLSEVGPVDARRMFGGYGVYAGMSAVDPKGVFFALLDDDELFLKTDGETRERFRAAGCRMWVYPGSDETSYWRPPDEAHDDAEAMAPWARLGLEAALRARAAKATRKRKHANAPKAAKPAKPAAKRSRAGGAKRR